uniref:Uncharacterized protein n=1 Tax=Knipowitschia caucasica TaxID=637954 RepID=A0AAV2J676_KNICA
MRDNLLFMGIKEQPNETYKTSEGLVRSFLLHQLGLSEDEVEAIQVDRAHRLGERKTVACTDHNLKRGNGDHGKQSATSPNVVNQARAKFRTVAIIARSFGSFTPRHISLKESTGKHTGMKYRARPSPSVHVP